ncbi:hypothetical protein F442_02087, partial [Phytophthora nicotianae P10297]
SLCHHSSTSHEAAHKAVDTEEERPTAKQKQGQEVQPLATTLAGIQETPYMLPEMRYNPQ